MQEVSEKTLNLRKEVWIIAGRDQFAKYGLKGINIDLLSKKLDISRTSFYHFFETKEKFLEQMVDYWIQDGTVRVIEASKGITDPKSRMKKIYNLALHNDVNDRFMAQLRYAAAKNEYLKKRMKEVDDLRIKILTHLFKEIGLRAKESREHAQLIYMLFLGFIELHKAEGYSEDKIQEFINMVISTIFE